MTLRPYNLITQQVEHLRNLNYLFVTIPLTTDLHGPDGLSLAEDIRTIRVNPLFVI